MENHDEMLKKDEKYNDSMLITDSYDRDGYTCSHWAAKKGDIQMLQLLLEFKSTLSEATHNESKMLPIHWGASDGRIETTLLT